MIYFDDLLRRLIKECVPEINWTTTELQRIRNTLAHYYFLGVTDCNSVLGLDWLYCCSLAKYLGYEPHELQDIDCKDTDGLVDQLIAEFEGLV